MANPAADFAELMGIATGYQRSRALAVASELGIADLLADGPRAIADLAQATGTHEPTLYRLLRALASLGVFHEDAERRFSLTRMGELLRSDAPASVGSVARFFGRDYHWTAWGHLLHSVRTGENASRAALGVDVWTHRQRHPEENDVFNAAMAALSRAGAVQETAAYDFARHRIIADVGGGTGAFLAAILRRCRAVTSRDARLLLIESVVGPPNEDPRSKFLDLVMLVSAGGRERTEPEWQALLARGGFRMCAVHPTGTAASVIEAAPA